MPKKKTLPKNFEDLLKERDLAKLEAVFETCDVDARGGSFKQTALAFAECPDELTRWLVARGADLAATNAYGETPLHSRAGSWRGRVDVLLALGADANAGEGGRGTPLHLAAGARHEDNARRLLAHGARVDALDKAGSTPLEYALQRCHNADVARMAKIAALLLEAGARKTERMRALVTRIGTNFEFHRSGFNPELLDAAAAGLEWLYSMFDVTPVPRRAMHDGTSPIVATGGCDADRYEDLWQRLVPSSGAADTIQGEVIRIAGKIAREIDGNGGVNWDAQFRTMADAWLAHVGSKNALPPTALSEAATIVAAVKKDPDRVGDIDRLRDLALAWVALNPTPAKLAPPSYSR